MPRLLSLLALVCPAVVAAAEPLDGDTFSQTAAVSTNVMRVHLDFLDAQNDYDLSTFYALVDGKSAKTDLLLGDGQQFEGGLVHWRAGLGLGWGHPRTSVAVFGGVHAEGLKAGSWPYGDAVDNFHASVQDRLWYVGGAFKGYQLSYGQRVVTRTTGLGLDGEFAASSEGSFRAGAPSIVADPRKRDIATRTQLITVYSKAGVSGGGLLADLLPEGSYTPEEAKQTVLASLRAKFETNKNPQAGKYGVGIDGYRQGFDYYREGVPLGQDPDNLKKSVEIPIGGTDIGSSGFGIKIVPMVAPSIRLRSFDMAFRRDLGNALVGGRFSYTHRDGGWEPSWDLYAMFAAVALFDNGFQSGNFAVSYSYNAPDAATFLPYSKMHVIGIQFSVGIPGMTPIVPPAALWRPGTFDQVDPDHEYYLRGEETPLEVVEPEPPPNVLPKDPDAPTAEWTPPPRDETTPPDDVDDDATPDDVNDDAAPDDVDDDDDAVPPEEAP